MRAFKDDLGCVLKRQTSDGAPVGLGEDTSTMETVHKQTLLVGGGDTCDPVDTPRGSQQTLRGFHSLGVAFDLGHEDSMLQAQNGFLYLLPVNLAPGGGGLSSICVNGFPHRQHAFRS